MTVSGITVKDAGTLIKPDGTEIKVTTGTTVADAAKSDETTASDITASEDVKQEVETSKKEEAVIEEAKEAVTKAEEIADNTTDNNGGNSDDTIIADNSSNESSDNNHGNIGSSDNNNSDNNVTPANPTPDETEDKKDEASAPADPEPTPIPVEPEKKAIRSCWPHLQLSNGYMGGQGELEEIGDYLLPQYVDGSLSETETKNMIMNGRLYDIYNWDVDGNQQDTIPEAKMISVEIRKWDKTQIQEMRNVLFGEWIGEVLGKASGSYVRCDKEGTPYEWYAFLITYEMP